MEKEPITISGLLNLKAELEDLKNIQRPKIVEAIAEARSHGDLKENAEYHAAKEQQALIESRVIAINDIIARANVIDVTKIENNGKVIFGSTVKVQDLETDKKISYKLVGQDEADLKKNLIFLNDFNFDFVFYIAGVDIHLDDRLGKLCITDKGINKRDEMVIGNFFKRKVPICGVLGGGYNKDFKKLIELHSSLHKNCAKYLNDKK